MTAAADHRGRTPPTPQHGRSCSTSSVTGFYSGSDIVPLRLKQQFHQVLDCVTAERKCESEGSMTSWRYLTYLFVVVFLSKIDLSEEACDDHFDNLSPWATNLTNTISYVETEDSKDIVECTLERECQLGKSVNICSLLICLRNERVAQGKGGIDSEKCKRSTSRVVPVYHLFCLVAKVFNRTPKGCEFETTCKLYSEASVAFYQTTTTLSPRTTERTTAAAATTTTTTTTTSVTQSAVSGSNGQTAEIKTETEISKNSLKILLLVSGFLHVVVPLAVYLCMRRGRKQDCGQSVSSVICVTNGVLPEAQLMAELKSNTVLAYVKEDEAESSHLIQPPECDSIITTSAHMRSDCTVGNEMLHQ